MFRLTKISVENFGPFVGKHLVELPENGLSLIRGKVLETGDGSGAGKSYLLNSISYVLGFCPFPATELQSWYTDEPPQATIEILTDKGLLTLTRKKGLTLKSSFLPEKEYKGKAAETMLDLIFGMDKKLREQVTYRPQGAPGLFLEMDDAEKKSFLSKVLELGKYELVADSATKAVSKLEQEVRLKQNAYTIALDSCQKAAERLKVHCYPNNLDKLVVQKGERTKLLDELRIKKSELNTRIEVVRKANDNELNAVLATIRAKMAQINNRGEPLEIQALKAELQKQQERLEKCHKYDEQQRLSAQKAKDGIRVQLKEIETKHVIETAEITTRFNSDIAACKTEIARLIGSENRLKTLESDLRKLNESKCPTCGQMWEDSVQQIKNTSLLVESCKIDIQKLNEYKTRLTHLEADRDQHVSVSKTELKDKLAIKKSELDNIKDPEPHPAGLQVRQKISEINNSIKELEESSRLQKKKDLESVFAEEKDIRSQFQTKTDNEIEELQVQVFDLETESAQKGSELTRINNEITYIQREEVVHNELAKSLKNTEESLLVAKAEYESILSKLNLESDIAALVGRQGFLGAIFADVLDEISSQANDIISKVANVRHLTIDLETEKESSTTGSITSRITPVIYNKGRKISYKGGISGGMRTAIQLAVDLAVGNVVSNRRGTFPNFLILDEALDGLGELAKESCLEMLQSVAGDKLVLVVDHSTGFCNLFAQIIDVEQLDGISRVI